MGEALDDGYVVASSDSTCMVFNNHVIFRCRRRHDGPCIFSRRHRFASLLMLAACFWNGVLAGNEGNELGRFKSKMAIRCEHGFHCGGDGGSPHDRMEKDDDDDVRMMRSLQGGQQSLCAVMSLNKSILASCNDVFVETPSSEFSTSDNSIDCAQIIRNIVFVPNDTAFYYIHQQTCSGNDSLIRSMYSIKAADLRRMNDGVTPTGRVISYWWNFSNPDGPPLLSPIPYRNNGPVETWSIALVNCMDLSRDGKYLVLSAESYDANDRSRLTLMRTVDGHRSSSLMPTNYIQGLTFNPSKTKLYVSDGREPLRIFSAVTSVDGERSKTTESKEIGPLDSSGNKVTSIWFNPYSFDKSESCLYFSEYTNNRVWGFNPISVQPTLVTDSGEDGNTSFSGTQDVVTTPDGCNLFLVETSSSSIRWIELDSPCSRAQRVTTVGSYDGGVHTIFNLALRDNGSHMSLYATSTRGYLIEIGINKSNLHVCNPPSPPAAPSGSTTNLALVVGVPISALLAFIVVIGAGCLLRPKIKEWYDGRTNDTPLCTVPLSDSITVPHAIYASEPNPFLVRQFALTTLSESTGNFSDKYRIGERGAFGDVYWGTLEDGVTQVAVKLMRGELTDIKRKQFLAEVNTLSRLHHTNLLDLTGYCQESDCSILVYPYVPGGSLFARLHNTASVDGNPPPPLPLTLVERMYITLQIANGLRYLHEGVDPPVLHRDIKSSNVLLDNGVGAQLRAYLADFGLAVIGESVFNKDRATIVMTSHVSGTAGYMAPEYLLQGRLTKRNDVYALGVLMLEILTGKRVARPLPSGRGWETIVDWVRPFVHNINTSVLLNDVLDSSLKSQVQSYSSQEMVTAMLRLAMECVQTVDLARPKVGAVAETIAKIMAIAGVRIE